MLFLKLWSLRLKWQRCNSDVYCLWGGLRCCNDPAWPAKMRFSIFPAHHVYTGSRMPVYNKNLKKNQIFCVEKLLKAARKVFPVQENETVPYRSTH